MPRTKALQNWYGSNRGNTANEVGVELGACDWVGVTFVGGASELLYLKAKTIGVNDAHKHLINMLQVMADVYYGPALIRHLRRQPFTSQTLADAQELCRKIEAEKQPVTAMPSLFSIEQSETTQRPMDDRRRMIWAGAYFVAGWMGRGGNAGTPAELKGGLPLRWDADGGGSATRYQSAVRSLPAWRRRVLSRCEFTTLDFADFLAKVKDRPGIGVYCDPPFPGPGDRYTHQLGPKGQERLAAAVGRFKHARVVMRFYDVPLVRQLYPEGKPWVYREFTGRDQHNNPDKRELLIINGPSKAA